MPTLDIQQLQMFTNNIVLWIAGSIQLIIIKKMKCFQCLETICDEDEACSDTFIDLKRRGNLTSPHKDVYVICNIAEKTFKEMTIRGGVINHSQITASVFRRLDITKILKKLPDHTNDFSDGIHKYDLIRTIISYYIDIRSNHYLRNETYNLRGEFLRSKLKKLVLFHNQ